MKITKPAEAQFNIGDAVAKKKGSNWHGRVVGYYSTTLNDVGVCVESHFEEGSVQLYPESALEAWVPPSKFDTKLLHLNATVRVHLTDKGRAHLAQLYNEHADDPEKAKLYRERPVDDEGRTPFSLHSLIHIFGSQIHAGNVPMFLPLNIEVANLHLKPGNPLVTLNREDLSQ